MVAFLLFFGSPWDKNCFKDLQRVFLRKCFSDAFTNQVEIIFCTNQHATDAFHLALKTISLMTLLILNFSFLFILKTWANLLFQNDTRTFNRTNIYFNTQPTQTQVPWNRTKKTLDHASLAYTSFSNLTKTTHKATDHHFASGSLVSKCRVLKWQPAEIPYAYYNFMSSRHTNCSLPDSQQPIQSY